MLFNILATSAEFEADLIRMRTRGRSAGRRKQENRLPRSTLGRHPISDKQFNMVL